MDLSLPAVSEWPHCPAQDGHRSYYYSAAVQHGRIPLESIFSAAREGPLAMSSFATALRNDI